MRADPKTFPTTVGIVAKNPPFDAPLMIEKMIRGASEFETGHSASMLRALTDKAMNSAFNGPIQSQARPLKIRPTAEEKLKEAMRPAPAAEENPRDPL